MSWPRWRRALVPSVVLVGLGVSAFGYGFHAARAGCFPYAVFHALFSGGEASGPPASGSRNEEARRRRALLALPYLAGYRRARGRGRPVEIESAACEGYNLVVSGHAPEAVLMDMAGNVLHRWRSSFEQAWGEGRGFEASARARDYFRRAYLFENGDLLAIFEGVGLVKLDRDSRILWKYPGRTHQSVSFDEQGNIYTLGLGSTLRLETERYRIEGGTEDFIDVLSPAGERRQRVSLIDCFLASPYAPLLELIQHTRDPLHANTVVFLDGRLAERVPMFKRGHVLVCLRNLSTVAVVDLEARRVTWALHGLFKYQHESLPLPNGHLMVFDNAGRIPRPAFDEAAPRVAVGRSRILEIDPLTQQVVWSYGGPDGAEDFFSLLCGVSQPLANGNVLVTNSWEGEAFEVTRSGHRVWSWSSPHRVERGAKVATLFQVTRIPREAVRFPLRAAHEAGRTAR